MLFKAKTSKEQSGSEGGAYLTRRVLRRAISKDADQLIEEAMKLRGFVIQVRGGWIVRIDRNGKVTRLKKLPFMSRPSKMKLD